MVSQVYLNGTYSPDVFLNVSGDVTLDAPVNGNVVVNLDGATAQTVTSDAAGYLTNLNVANSTDIVLPTTLILTEYGASRAAETSAAPVPFNSAAAMATAIPAISLAPFPTQS